MAGKKKETVAQVPVANALLSSPILAALVAAGASGTWYSEAELTPFVSAGYAEMRTDMKDDAGRVACRITDKGATEFAAASPAQPAPAPSPFAAPAQPATPSPVASTEASPSKFALRKNIPVPPVKGRGGKGGVAVYPFEQMEVGDSFFVPATPDRPNPAKSLASTVSSATKRYGRVTLGPDGKAIQETVKVRGKDYTRDKLTFERVFIARSAEENGVKGAYVGRTK